MAGSAILAIKIIADASQAAKELAGTSKKLEKFESGVGAAALPATAVVGALGAMTVAAAEDAAEQAKLEKAIQSAGAATGDYAQEVEGAIKAGQKRGFSDSEVREGLQSLVTATGDVEGATEAMATAQDVARFAGVPLATASDAVAKALAGQAGPLQKLIPGLEKTKDASVALGNAQAIAAGQADTYASTSAAKLGIVADSFGELGETIGTTFLPVLDAATGLLSDLAGFLEDNMAIIQPLVAIVGGFAGVILALNAAVAIWGAVQTAASAAAGIWTGIQWLLNAALAANPIGLIVLAIIALVAIFVVAYQKSETFRNIVQGVFKAVVGFVETAIATIKGIFEGILEFLRKPWEAVQPIIQGVFDAIGDIVTAAIDIVSGIFDTILAFLRDPFETFQGIVETVFGLVEDVIETAIGVIKGIFDGVLAILSDPFKAFEGLVKQIMDTVTGLVESAVGVINGILDGIRGAIKTVSDAVDAINPFAALPPAGAAPAPTASVAGLGRRSSRIGGGTYVGGPPNMVVQVTSADPEQVMRAIRRWSRANGGSGPFTRGLDRSTA